MMRRVYSPESEGERIFLESLLQASDIPYHIDAGGYGSLFPGLQIDGYSRKWVMVPEEYVAEAVEVIRGAVPPREDVEVESVGWIDRVRMVGEALFFGWFVPGRRKRPHPDDDGDFGQGFGSTGSPQQDSQERGPDEGPRK